MKSKQLKFLVGSIAILVALVYFGYQGFNESMSYFQTVPELYASGDKAYDRKSIKVQGEVMKGSIRREGAGDSFRHWTHRTSRFRKVSRRVRRLRLLQIRYVGTDAIPDTFRDYASAIVTGRMRKDGTFEGTFIQAQCASKYERENAAGRRPRRINRSRQTMAQVGQFALGARLYRDALFDRGVADRDPRPQRQADRQRPQCRGRQLHRDFRCDRLPRLSVSDRRFLGRLRCRAFESTFRCISRSARSGAARKVRCCSGAGC